MRYLCRYLCLTALLFLCAPVGAPAASPSAPPLNSALNSTHTGWCRFTNPGYWGWYQNGLLQARWHAGDQTWEEWTGRAWLPPSPAPWLKPEQLPGARPDRGGINYGLDTSKLAQYGERFLIGGEQVERWEAEASIGDFKDDSKLPQVTVLDPDKRRREEAYAALTTSLAGKARVNAADPSNKDQLPFLAGWKLPEDKRFQAAGAATFIQAPRDPKDGCAKVVSAIYAGLPPEQLSAEVGVRVSPNYDPAKNPTNGAAVQLDWGWLWNKVLYPLLLILMGVGGGAYVARPGKPGEKDEPEQTPTPTDFSPAAMLVRAVEQYKAAEAQESERLARLAEEKARVKEAILALAK